MRFRASRSRVVGSRFTRYCASTFDVFCVQLPQFRLSWPFKTKRSYSWPRFINSSSLTITTFWLVIAVIWASLSDPGVIEWSFWLSTVKLCTHFCKARTKPLCALSLSHYWNRAAPVAWMKAFAIDIFVRAIGKTVYDNYLRITS